jgi:RHS repeat-associated protein
MIAVNSNTILGVDLDPSGRLAARKDRVDDRVFNFEFAYDAAGRLTRVSRDGVPVEEYAYDAQGRRSEDTSSLRSVMGRLHEYDDLGRLRKAGYVEYTYDHADRLASRAEGVRIARYSYDREGRLIKARLPNDHVIEYIHDPQGKRVARLRDGEVVQRYYWLDFVRLLAVHDGRDREKVRFEYGESRVPVAMRHKDMTYRIETDQVGSPLALVDRDGRVVKRVIYDSFGNIVHDDNPKLKLPLAFAGGLWDKETGLVHFGHRDYDPDVGRFTTKDPIGYAGGDPDLYGYGFDDPVNLVDPWGLKTGDWWDFPANYQRADEIAKEELAKRPRAHNNAEDARRHAEWSRRVQDETNTFTAWSAGVGHELVNIVRDGSPINEVIMDLHNNAEGRTAARQERNIDPGRLMISPDDANADAVADRYTPDVIKPAKRWLEDAAKTLYGRDKSGQ